MAAPQSSVDQLLELILQLKKTTPAAAKQILNSQPQIAYAVIGLLVSMNAIDIEVFKKTLADFAAQQAAPQAGSSSTQPAPAIPPHMQQQSQYRTTTPPVVTPTPPIAQPQPGYGHNGYQTQGYGYGTPTQQQQQYGGYGPGGYQPQSHQTSYGQGQQGSGYGPQPTAQAPTPQAQSQDSVLSQINPSILAAIPEEQKPMIMHVLSMTPEAISKLSPQDRANVMQLRTTLGLAQ